ncbi:SanA/YdcF family protein [Leminorella richardii]|uniref:SanA/YdcF family protein n=1 Tax=Leminorella richardii TaxID=158841 RepID=UPI0039EA2598
MVRLFKALLRLFKAICRKLFSRRLIFLYLLVAAICLGLIGYAEREIVGATEAQLYSNVQDIPARNVALVLGAKPNNRYFTRRIDAAAELYHAGKVQWLLVSGDNGKKHYDEPSAMQRALIEKGVPKGAIFCDYAGFSTLDSVVRANKVFGENSFTIVSQRFHNQRALYLAQQYGIDAIAYDAKDLPIGRGKYTQMREKLARVSALLDSRILNRQPKFLGPSVVIGPNTDSGCPSQ